MAAMVGRTVWFALLDVCHRTGPRHIGRDRRRVIEPTDARRTVVSTHRCGHIEELRILKFQTVEQIAAASDAQLQRIGMGGPGLREKAKAFLNRRNRSETENQLDETKKQLAELKTQSKERNNLHLTHHMSLELH